MFLSQESYTSLLKYRDVQPMIVHRHFLHHLITKYTEYIINGLIFPLQFTEIRKFYQNKDLYVPTEKM